MAYFRVFEILRDYTMFDRSEAPQYYPPVVIENKPHPAVELD